MATCYLQRVQPVLLHPGISLPNPSPNRVRMSPIRWPNGPIDAIIFDCDGVLLGRNGFKVSTFIFLDTERLYTEVGNKIISKYSQYTDPALRHISADCKGRLMGRKKWACAELMVQEFRLDMTIQEYVDLSYAMEKEVFRACRPLPGAQTIVAALKSMGIPLGVATGSSGCVFTIKRTEHAFLFSCFEHIVVGDDPSVLEGKPAPDIFVEAARRLGQADMSRCLVVEDSPNGVRAGLAAGMHVAWVPDPCLEVRENMAGLVADPRVVLFDSLVDLHSAILGSSQ